MSRNCSDCAFADFRYNNAPVGSGRSTFLCAMHNKFRTYGDNGCGEWKDRYKDDHQILYSELDAYWWYNILSPRDW